MAHTKLGTLLQIVSQAAGEIGITQRSVSSVVDSADQDIQHMRYLLNAVAMEVTEEEPYLTTLGTGDWIIDAETGDLKTAFDSDEDLIAFDRRLAVNGIKWRFLASKGLEFGEQQRDFITRLNKLASRANARVLDLDTDWSRVQ